MARAARQAAGTALAATARAQTIELERGEEELDGGSVTEAARVSLSANLQKLDEHRDRTAAICVQQELGTAKKRRQRFLAE
eukprot:13246226-Alexandrium_andersonii.AAC.1